MDEIFVDSTAGDAVAIPDDEMRGTVVCFNFNIFGLAALYVVETRGGCVFDIVRVEAVEGY